MAEWDRSRWLMMVEKGQTNKNKREQTGKGDKR